MDNLAQRNINGATNPAGLAAGTTTTTTIANNTNFAIRGKGYTKNSASNAATPTTDAVTGVAFNAIAVNKAGVFVICLDSSGAIKIVQGSIVDYNDDGTFSNALPQFPEVPDTLAPIGYELVKVISTGSSWTMGSSNQASQTGITKVFVDCMLGLPDRPQSS